VSRENLQKRVGKRRGRVIRLAEGGSSDPKIKSGGGGGDSEKSMDSSTEKRGVIIPERDTSGKKGWCWT